MQIRKLVLAIVCAVMAAGVAAVYANNPKNLIDHKGNIQCVDDDSLPAHLAHGDTIEDVC